MTYKKIASHEAEKGTFSKCLLLYSGGLDTSMMMKWIQEEYECEIIALTMDIGQTADDLELIKTKGLKLGAKEVIIYCEVTGYTSKTKKSYSVFLGGKYVGKYWRRMRNRKSGTCSKTISNFTMV